MHRTALWLCCGVSGTDLWYAGTLKTKLEKKVSELEGAVRHVQQQRQKQEEAGERDRQRALREIEVHIAY